MQSTHTYTLTLSPTQSCCRDKSRQRARRTYSSALTPLLLHSSSTAVSTFGCSCVHRSHHRTYLRAGLVVVLPKGLARNEGTNPFATAKSANSATSTACLPMILTCTAAARTARRGDVDACGSRSAYIGTYRVCVPGFFALHKFSLQTTQRARAGQLTLRTVSRTVGAGTVCEPRDSVGCLQAPAAACVRQKKHSRTF